MTFYSNSSFQERQVQVNSKTQNTINYKPALLNQFKSDILMCSLNPVYTRAATLYLNWDMSLSLFSV